jgi:hypothetical protein
MVVEALARLRTRGKDPVEVAAPATAGDATAIWLTQYPVVNAPRHLIVREA